MQLSDLRLDDSFETKTATTEQTEKSLYFLFVTVGLYRFKVLYGFCVAFTKADIPNCF